MITRMMWEDSIHHYISFLKSWVTCLLAWLKLAKIVRRPWHGVKNSEWSYVSLRTKSSLTELSDIGVPIYSPICPFTHQWVPGTLMEDTSISFSPLKTWRGSIHKKEKWDFNGKPSKKYYTIWNKFTIFMENTKFP